MSELGNDLEEELSIEEEQELSAEPENESTVPPTILQLEHSFGYDCKRVFNLCLIDENTLVFASGNYLHYLNITTGNVTFRASVYGGGIGFITKNDHPDFQGLLTVGENGHKPTIFVYEYPKHDIRVRMEGAAKNQFTTGSYNSTGDLFASQAGRPDFMLTIWRWQSAEIILRAKSYQNNVMHVHFSRFNPILLCSSGLSHIKFWKMANTFTGLKLQGDLGRFGKTDFSDIYAIYMLADENVISGCDWGNMLLWEAGLIKFEICRKGRRTCHAKPITRITYRNGEVTTVGMDGYVRIWFWETVDLADPPEDDRFVEIEPIYEFNIGDCEIRSLIKIKLFDDRDYGYYAQDGKGGIWYCDLNTEDKPEEPRKLYSCHGGKVVAAGASPVSSHFITLGEDGKLFVYDYKLKSLLLERQIASPGTDLLWFDTDICKTGMEFVASFEDGIIRHFLLNLRPPEPQLQLASVIKAHIAAITRISVNPKKSVLITGSADHTIFMYDILGKKNDLVHLKPMCFIVFEGIPNTFYWFEEEPFTVLIGCKAGEVYQYILPKRVTEDRTYLSYNTTDASKMLATRFVSVKSIIRREIKREKTRKRKEAKRKRKLAEIEKLKKANPGLQIDMESALADSEPEEDEDPLYYPPSPNPVLWIKYTPVSTMWLSMGGYDAGYIYEFNFESKTPVRCTLITDCDDIEIHSYLQINEYLIFGLGNGKLRVNNIYPEDFTDLSDFRLFNMHDALIGTIPRLFMSYRGAHLFSIGHDGNVFMYTWIGPQPGYKPNPVVDIVTPLKTEAVDIVDPEHPSLEQEKINAELRRQEEAAQAHARKVLDSIAHLQIKFNKIMARNEKLHEDVRIPHRELLLDDRITKQIEYELQAELDDERDDLAYDLEFAQVGKRKLFEHFFKNLDHIPIRLRGVGNNIVVDSIRHEALTEQFLRIKEAVDERLRLEMERHKAVDHLQAEPTPDVIPKPGIEDFFFGRDPRTIIPRFSRKMLRLLRSYRKRKLYNIERTYHWDKLDKNKPDPDRNDPEDERKIREAQRTIGDYKLKIGYDYAPRSEDNLTHKYEEIIRCREFLFESINKFNDALFDLREEKKQIFKQIEANKRRLQIVHQLIPKKCRVHLPDIPDNTENEEYPELNLIEHFQPGCGIDIIDILYLEKPITSLLPKPVEKVPEPKFTVEETIEFIKYDMLKMREVESFPKDDEFEALLESLPSISDPAYTESVGNETVPWLKDVRFRWLCDLIDEQNFLISDVKASVKKYNELLADMYHKRCLKEFEMEFMQCYMITLNQELVVMRDSEEIENQLMHYANSAMLSRNHARAIINATKRHINSCIAECASINEEIAAIQQKFQQIAKPTKFYDFLKRIFKKKWKPPKRAKADGESSSEESLSESSSSSDDDDAKSVDSLDMTTIRLDEDTCPNGLDRKIYDMAFKLRSNRQALEKKLVEVQKVIESRRSSVIQCNRQVNQEEAVFYEQRKKLMDFRRSRQHELNKVKVAVFLNLNQIQHFEEDRRYRKLNHAILFDAERLGELRHRVDELKVETQETKRIYRVNIVHLRRMSNDIKFMKFEITKLETDIREEMTKKFGFIVNLDELEEEVLRKYIFELETTAEDELAAIDREIWKKQRELAALESELIAQTRLNSEKLNVYSILMEEKNILNEILLVQDKREAKPEKHGDPLNLDYNIANLLSIDAQQIEQIQCLEREICTMRMKPKPLQIDHGDGDKAIVVLSPDDPNACPEELNVEAYNLRMMPDELLMERIDKIVLRFFNQRLASKMSKDKIRRYSHEASQYLAQAAYSVQGKFTDRILMCITESLEAIIPKKYLLHIKIDEIHKLFENILGVFDYERSDVNTEDLISGIYNNAKESMGEVSMETTATQVILESVFKELIEVLPIEEFQSDTTVRVLSELMAKDHVDIRCLHVENLIAEVVQYARTNLLDDITSIHIRRLVTRLAKDLHPNLTDICSSHSLMRGSMIRVTKRPK